MEKLKNSINNSEANADSQSNSEKLSYLGQLIQAICNGIEDGIINIANTVPAISTTEFDISAVENVNLRNCNDGIFFGSFIEDEFDGIIKMVPGAFKKKTKSKENQLKFFVVVGNVEITVEGKRMKLGPMDHISINPGVAYEMRNTSDENVIIYTTRFQKVL